MTLAWMTTIFRSAAHHAVADKRHLTHGHGRRANINVALAGALSSVPGVAHPHATRWLGFR